MDWQQVVLNGGPPCFNMGEDGYFCGRAQRWDGHDSMHRFISLADLLTMRSISEELAAAKQRIDILEAQLARPTSQASSEVRGARHTLDR